MTMTTRRTFMQSLAALLASTPLLRSARGTPTEKHLVEEVTHERIDRDPRRG